MGGLGHPEITPHSNFHQFHDTTEDFWFDGAPDTRVGFGTDGKFVKLTDFEPLKCNSGAQVYKVPSELNVADFDTIYIWCRKFSVPLGLAPLTGATSG